jgi:phenylalanyl-tRNA synthetase beta subunit
LSENHQTLRTSLIPSLEKIYKNNYERVFLNNKYFTYDQIYHEQGNNYHLGIIFNSFTIDYYSKVQKLDDYLLFGILKSILQNLLILFKCNKESKLTYQKISNFPYQYQV